VLGGREVGLAEGVRVAASDIYGLEPSDGSGWGAEVLRNPADPQVLGLKNLSRQRWKATFASGRQVEIDPGRSLRLEAGARVNFGQIEGRILLGSAHFPSAPFAANRRLRVFLRRVRANVPTRTWGWIAFAGAWLDSILW